MSMTTPGRPVPGTPQPPVAFDPLRLCIYTTIALLTWIFGPVALLAFAVLGIRGYLRAKRQGLMKSRCYLGDVRLVLTYLAIVAAAAVVGIGFELSHLLH